MWSVNLFLNKDASSCVISCIFGFGLEKVQHLSSEMNDDFSWSLLIVELMPTLKTFKKCQHLYESRRRRVKQGLSCTGIQVACPTFKQWTHFCPLAFVWPIHFIMLQYQCWHLGGRQSFAMHPVTDDWEVGICTAGGAKCKHIPDCPPTRWIDHCQSITALTHYIPSHLHTCMFLNCHTKTRVAI